MKMKLSEIRIRQKNLMALSSKKLPHRIAYAVAKNLMKLEAESGLIEARRMEMVHAYAVKDENNNPVIKDMKYDLGDKEELFSREYMEFLEMETEVDIQMISCMDLEVLENTRYDVLTAVELMALDFMIESDDICVTE